jgi:hypothetical protein
MPESARPVTTIRIRREALREARIAAVTAGVTLGQWLETAIKDKLDRESAVPTRPSGKSRSRNSLEDDRAGG